MNYKSTRNSHCNYTCSQAIITGIAPDGGLFVPREIPTFDSGQLTALVGQSYQTVAACVLSKYLDDFTDEQIEQCVQSAYSDEKFGGEPVCFSSLGDQLYSLELWHGPTCAFKDMALQMLPHLMRYSNQKSGDGNTVRILVATSGDTGKAALEGFKDAPNTKITVFYPQHGVSNMQKRQMITQEGENVQVIGIDGNFDDAQSGVKQIFTSSQAAQTLAQQGERFSSANSINWGRLLPQIVYYVYTYTSLASEGQLSAGQVFDVSVPTGNFGNILAAYYAKMMGVPIGKLICASNDNCVLTDFFKTGTYDKNREFYATSSPSMDILISSNLERLLYLLGDEDDKLIQDLYQQLSKNGSFTVPDFIKQKLNDLFFASFATEKQVDRTISTLFEEHGYLCDTHTAVGFYAAWKYRNISGKCTPMVIASTASPYKFADSVLNALGQPPKADDFERLEQLSQYSKTPIPAPLLTLKDKPVRFATTCNPKDMFDEILKG